MLMLKRGLLLFLIIMMLMLIIVQRASVKAQNQVASPILTPTPQLSKEAQIALQYFSTANGIPPERLFVGEPAIIQYPLTAKKVWEVAVGELGGGKIGIVTLNLANDTVIDGPTAKQAERNAHQAKYGKLEPALFERLQTLNASQPISVAVWLSAIDVDQIKAQVVAKHPEAKLIDFRPGPDTDLKLYEKIYAEMSAAIAQAHQGHAAPLIAKLRAGGGKVIYSSENAPLLFAELSKAMILQLATQNDVSEISLNSVVKPLLNSVIPTDRVPTVWQRGYTGTGVQVAVVEKDGIDFDHNDLANGVYANPGNPNIDTDAYHATEVAGVIASTHSTYKGVAYNAPALYSANAGSYVLSDLVNATEKAIATGTTTTSATGNSRILNLSFGNMNPLNSIDDLARYYDHIVRDKLCTVVTGPNDFIYQVIGAPGIGYNVITVGGIDDQNTGNWSDDTIWDDHNVSSTGSAYSNPSDGREKPEVAAVARYVTTTYQNSSFTTVEGNSFAIPQVSGLAALLMQRDTTLQYKPEAVKAIIMASAVHNADGGDSLVSDKDGVGAIDAALADTIVRNGWWTLDSIATSVPQKSYNFYAVAGERVRVVLFWPSHTANVSNPPYTDELHSNLDLYVAAPNGTITTNSTSVRTADNFEIVEFTAGSSGTHQIQVKRGPASANEPVNDNESFGVAWSRTGTFLPDIRSSSSGWNCGMTMLNPKL